MLKVWWPIHSARGEGILETDIIHVPADIPPVLSALGILKDSLEDPLAFWYVHVNPAVFDKRFALGHKSIQLVTEHRPFLDDVVLVGICNVRLVLWKRIYPPVSNKKAFDVPFDA